MQPNRPKITVGMPVYNGEALLPRALESWLSQSFDDIEIIISDNGSEDNTEAVYKYYASTDDRVVFYRYPFNMGGARTLSRLVDTARGKYFVFGFHNDFFDSSYLEKCFSVLENDPSIVICYAGACVVDDNGNTLQNITDDFRMDSDDLIYRHREMLQKLNLCNCFHGVMRTDVLLKTMPFQATAAGDVNLLLRMILEGKIYQIDEPLIYRAAPNHKKYSSPTERWNSFDAAMRPTRPNCDFSSLPFISMIDCAVMDVCTSEQPDRVKEKLINNTVMILLNRYKACVEWEINNLINEVKRKRIRYLWKNGLESKTVDKRYPLVRHFYLLERLFELERILAYDSTSADIHFAAGLILQRLGRFAEARQRLNIALRIQPGHTDAAALVNTLSQSSCAPDEHESRVA